MNLSRTSSYAILAVIRMASLPMGQISTGHSLAKELSLPEGYLLRILVALAKGGVLRSSKGPNGGYWLTRPANKITLLDIIEAAEGPIVGRADAVGGDGGADRLDTRLRELCEEATTVYRKQLAGVNIAALASGPKKRKTEA